MPEFISSEYSKDDEYAMIGRLASANYANPDFFAVFLPNRNKRKELIDKHHIWVASFKEVISRINNGTSSSIKDGTWLEEDNEITFEETTIIESYIFDKENFIEQFPKIVSEMHRFGRETEQSSVAFIYSGVFYTIEHYEKN